MRTNKILLVEDDDLSSEITYNYLVDCGFNITPVFTATDTLAHIKTQDYDLVLLDINLPDFNGFEVLKSIKNRVSLPIIITSADSETKSKLLAFRYGASDYMVKPLDLEELEARIWLQLGKSSEMETKSEKRLFELKGSTIFFAQKELDLTTMEFDILSMLIKHQSFVTKREVLVESLSSLSSQRSLDNHIKNIRKKIGDNGNKAIYLKTVYGVGYSLQH